MRTPLVLLFASNNANKIAEIQAAIGKTIEVISLKQANIEIDIPEPFERIEENASIKSKTIHALTKQNCFSEDTGLEVESLHGEPGVKSARYAGEDKSFDKNIAKLLTKLANNPNRKARFRTVISLIYNEQEYMFEGICEGVITQEPIGKGGFGYDSVFIPNGSIRSFAEMSMKEKNKFSHRRIAADKLVVFLNQASSTT